MPHAVNHFILDVDDEAARRLQRVVKRFVECQKPVNKFVWMDAVVMLMSRVRIRRRSDDQINLARESRKLTSAITVNHSTSSIAFFDSCPIARIVRLFLFSF